MTQESYQKYLAKNLARGTINAVKMKSLSWYERHVVYQSAAAPIVHFDYLHIRMKPQSTKQYRVAATTNPRPHYVIITISKDNMLRIYETTTMVQEPFANTRELMALNLTSEGVCSDPSEIVRLNSAKTPANSYKRNNEDLRPDDKPYVTVFLRDGRYFHFVLAVIDRSQSLISYKSRFSNQTRYIQANQTPNYPSRPDGSNKHLELKQLRQEYRRPEIRIETVLESDLVDVATQNLTKRAQGPNSSSDAEAAAK